MYNMDISIFGFKLNVEILILIGVVYLILVGHTLCGCCNYTLMETFETIAENVKEMKDASGNIPAPGGEILAQATKGAVSQKEGFSGLNNNYAQLSPYDLNSNEAIDTSSWDQPNMLITPGQPTSQGVKNFMAREKQQVPLPEGEMLLLAKTPFKPECCPNTYTTSTGCACMTDEQYKFLKMRGYNNVPYSQY
jgi:hypothetical protein